MKAMNFESSKWQRDAIDDVVVDEELVARRAERFYAIGRNGLA